jgi:hypothetical protein
MTTTVHQVAATPAERFALCLIVFQVDSETRQPVLQVRNGLEGRMLRSFVRALGLDRIRAAIAAGPVIGRLVNANEPRHLRVFSLPPDATQFFRERIADLPRTAAQECLVGELMDALHGVGPGLYGRPVSEPLEEWLGTFEGAVEDWAAPKPEAGTLEPGTMLPAADLQAAIDELGLGLSALPDTPEKARVLPLLEAFFDRVSQHLEVHDAG